MTGQPKQLCLSSDTKNLSAVRVFVAETLQDTPIAADERNKVVLAVDEAVANVMEHGYNTGDSGQIEVTVEVADRCIKVLVQDWGRSFDPRQVEDPDLEEHVRQGRKGGLGIYLIRQIMDEVSYDTSAGDGNKLVLVKYFA